MEGPWGVWLEVRFMGKNGVRVVWLEERVKRKS